MAILPSFWKRAITKTMKTLIQPLLLLLIIVTSLVCRQTVFASSTPPNPPQADHGGAGDLPPGGGAPLGNGTYVLISLGCIYLIAKLKKAYSPKTLLACILLLFVLQQQPVSASNIPPNPPSGGHGSSGDQPPGGGAPIGDGVFILLMAAMAYSVRKHYSKSNAIELEE